MKKAFTLLELSIVLVIIGLIVGGVVAGQELIKNAELSRIISDADSYKAATRAFQYKYDALPGDMENASEYWPDCDTTPSNCDGDGDGFMDNRISWVQLSSAGMVPGTYSYNATTYTVGVNVPAASIEPGGYMLGSSSVAVYNKPPGNILSVGRANDASTLMSTGFLTTVESKVIDDKIDDGLASYGNLIVFNEQPAGGGAFSTSGCVDGGNYSAAAADISWDLTNDNTRNCIISWRDL